MALRMRNEDQKNFWIFFFFFYFSRFLKIVNLGTENWHVHNDKHFGPKNQPKKILKTQFGRISRQLIKLSYFPGK